MICCGILERCNKCFALFAAAAAAAAAWKVSNGKCVLLAKGFA
jgi:hypothetical protein